MAKQPVCLICRKPCAAHERNADGSYTHDKCMQPFAAKPVGEGKRGGFLWGHKEPEE